jgi:hypothetical protein
MATNNRFFCYPILFLNNVIKISPIVFLLLFFSFCIHNVLIYGQRSDLQQLEKVDDFNNASNFEDINLVAIGDFYCNDETQRTIENIISINAELIITTGDHVKDEKSAKCWIEMSETIKDKMKIAIGNHDRDSSKFISKLLGIII